MAVKIKTVLMKNVTKMHGPLIHCEHNSGNKYKVYFSYNLHCKGVTIKASLPFKGLY